MAGRRRAVQPHQRGQRGCGQSRAAVHLDQDPGRGCPEAAGFLHAVPEEEEQARAARRPRHLQLAHRPGQPSGASSSSPSSSLLMFPGGFMPETADISLRF